MLSQINNLEELKAERRKLRQKIQTQKMNIKSSVQGLKQELQPARQVVNVMESVITRKSGDKLIHTTVDWTVDVLIRRVVLARAGWAARLVVPFLVRNIASNYLTQNKENVISTAATWLRKKLHESRLKRQQRLQGGKSVGETGLKETDIKPRERQTIYKQSA
jgi:hypothetical protein